MIPITWGRLQSPPSADCHVEPPVCGRFYGMWSRRCSPCPKRGEWWTILPKRVHISEEIPMPNEEQLELAERIIVRLNPPSRTAISKMIHAKAKVVGAIFTGYAVFWWLTVLQAEESIPRFRSIFFGPEFVTITIM